MQWCRGATWTALPAGRGCVGRWLCECGIAAGAVDIVSAAVLVVGALAMRALAGRRAGASAGTFQGREHPNRWLTDPIAVLLTGLRFGCLARLLAQSDMA